MSTHVDTHTLGQSGIHVQPCQSGRRVEAWIFWCIPSGLKPTETNDMHLSVYQKENKWDIQKIVVCTLKNNKTPDKLWKLKVIMGPLTPQMQSNSLTRRLRDARKNRIQQNVRLLFSWKLQSGQPLVVTLCGQRLVREEFHSAPAVSISRVDVYVRWGATWKCASQILLSPPNRDECSEVLIVEVGRDDLTDV